MNISDYINPAKKRPWVRRVADYSPGSAGRGFSLKTMTQDDFLNEVCPAAHPINSPMMSRRPIYGPTGEKDKNGKDKWAIVGYDDIETVAIGKQEAIIGKKIAHFAGDGFWVSNESEDSDRFSTLMSRFDMAGIKTGYIEAVRAAFRTGDSAIYVYQTNDPDDPIDYQVYDYEHGSTLYPRETFDGKKSVARKYKFDGHDAVDIFTPDTIETWMMLDEGMEDYRELVPEGMPIEKSEDGYTLIRRKAAQAGSNLCQCIYFRVDDIPTGPAQPAIEKLEDAKTYVGEHLKGSSMPILFMKAEKTTSLPPSNLANKIVGVKGTADALAHADMKFIAPPDASNIATFHINGVEQDIRDTCMSVFIDPEVIKQGSDSSTTMRILYDPEIQWAMIHWPEFEKSVKQLMLVFKALVGKAEEDVTGFAALKISIGQQIYVPQNKAEALKMELDAVYGRIKSRKAAIIDSGNTHKGDYEQVQKEWEEELKMKADIPAEAKAKYGTNGDSGEEPKDNPGDVNNQAPGKSIQQ